MGYLKGKDLSANESIRVNMDKISFFSVSGSGTAFSISANVVGAASSIVIKDGFTSKTQADTALDSFLSDVGIEVIN
jgi:hypothetical protein